jgi:hypothetical protein
MEPGTVRSGCAVAPKARLRFLLRGHPGEVSRAFAFQVVFRDVVPGICCGVLRLLFVPFPWRVIFVQGLRPRHRKLSEEVPHLVFLSAQIKFRVMTRPWPAGNAFHHAKPSAFKLLNFIWIIRQQSQLANAQRLQRLRRKFVIPRIRRKSKFAVRLHSIKPVILQLVCLQFIDQPNPAPLLWQIKQNARRLFRDLPQRKLQLRPAIASLRSKHIPSQTLRMHPHQRRLPICLLSSPQRPARCPAQLTTQNRNSLLPRTPLDPDNLEIPKTSRQSRPRHKSGSHTHRISAHTRRLRVQCACCRSALRSLTRLFTLSHRNSPL